MDSQVNPMFDDVLLLFNDLVLFWVIRLGNGNTGGDGGVQRADAVASSNQLLWELQLSPVVRGMLLA